LGRRGASLPVRDEDAVPADDKQADGGKARLPDLFVAVDAVSELDNAWKLVG
jgi:hypothetical protein